MSLARAAMMAFVATTDPERAQAFYRDSLGLQLLSDEPFALVFEANGVMLRIQKVERFQPQPFTVLGWQVRDIRATISALAAKGITMRRIEGIPQDELGVWRAGDDTLVAWFNDPDGNLLSLTQFGAM
ncbi:MAG: VOC family protein [Anaerolineae bacterium]|nr:VOC family protein [Anaerolineae bacterium]